MVGAKRGQRGNVNRKKIKGGVWVNRDRPITFCVFGTVNMGSNQDEHLETLVFYNYRKNRHRVK